MVFSPQSSPAAGKILLITTYKVDFLRNPNSIPELPKPSVTVVSEEIQEEVSVVETKPPTTVVTPKDDIKPSKIVKSVNKPLSSVIQVVANTAQPEPDRIIKPEPGPKVQVVSSYTEAEEATPNKSPAIKVIASQVHVIEEPKSNSHPAIFASHVDVKETEASTIVIAQEPKGPPVYSSIVEVQACIYP